MVVRDITQFGHEDSIEVVLMLFVHDINHVVILV